ncbi:alpha/beta fold hydrolase [Klenkia sp. LSe6-5]|uniref:Alpha/beta fold hydrolase n=1 Tax=Klenkia sesuvii TaxID=3103137 RepID=A0ABU8DWH0_9ACTN
MHTWGEAGPAALLVHGSILAGRATWSGLRPVAVRRTLLVADRRGYYPTSPADREDTEVDVVDLLGVLAAAGEPVHLVGHSRGTLPALVLARRYPEAIASLVLLEPPPCASAPAPAVDRWWTSAAEVLGHRVVASSAGPGAPSSSDLEDDVAANAHDADEGHFLRRFFALVGAQAAVPDPVPRQMREAAALLRRSGLPTLHPDLLDRPLGVPTLVVSGGHSEAFELGCGHLAEALGARHVVLGGAGHLVQQHPYCAGVLDAFWTAVDDGGPTTNKRHRGGTSDPAAPPSA